MSDSNSSSAGGGIGFLGALGLLFIGLKLTNHIDWPWLWVLAPLWLVPGILLALAFLFGMGVILLTVADKIRGARKSAVSPRQASTPRQESTRPGQRPYWRSK